MATSAPLPGRVRTRWAFGLLNIVGLLAVIAACAVLFTMYLLRLDDSDGRSAPPPAPYRVLVQHGSELWSAGPTGQAQAVPLPSGMTSQQTLRLSPDGLKMLIIEPNAGGDQLLLHTAPGSAPANLSLPPKSLNPGPWHIVAATWIDTHNVAVLLEGRGPSRGGVLAHYSIQGSTVVSPTWLPLGSGIGQLAALSPDAQHVARLETKPASGAFAGQTIVRLSQISGDHPTVAFRYLGEMPPEALLWSPDGGTLAIQVPGLGLEIRKSSGRPVREVVDGAVPAAFSPRGASLAFISGSGLFWQVHVLNLHGEIDSTLVPPSNGVPTLLGWTPDARALIYGTGNSLWQIDPASGASTRLPASVSGSLVGIVPAGAPFAR
ncbi:MAG: hypothetical protein JWO59_3040 [Chloroflexi bacterium]|nr:hypothetical protein [Chloroflexota bacterium]